MSNNARTGKTPRRSRSTVASGGRKGRPLAIANYVWVNTTTRTYSEQLVDRLVAVVQAAPTLTAATYKTWWDVEEALCRHLAGAAGVPLSGDLLGKILLTGDRWGLLRVNNKATGADWWIVTYPAAEALLTDPNPKGTLATLLLQQPFSEKHPHRHNLGLLGFLAACKEQGLGGVRVDEVGLFMARYAKEGPWGAEVARLKKRRAARPSGAVTFAEWFKVAAAGGGTAAPFAAEVQDVLSKAPSSEKDAAELLLSHRGALFFGAKEVRVRELVAELAPLVLRGEGDKIRARLVDDALRTAVDTHCDVVGTALNILAAVGLLEATPTRGEGFEATRYAVTDLGLLAFEQLRVTRKPRSYAEARDWQRNTHASAFARCADQFVDALNEKFVGDARYEGRRWLSERLDWNEFRGEGRAHEFEWYVVRSVFAVTAKAADHDLSQGVRTKLDHNLEAVHHAPGGGADAWLRTVRGRRLLIEATGVTGEGQVDQELSSVVRHVREATVTDPTAVTVFVAPDVSTDLVSCFLAATSGDEEAGVAPARVIPLTADQLRSLLVGRVAFDELVEDLLELVLLAAEQPGAPAARMLLAAIAGKVDAAVVASAALTAAPTAA